MIPKSTVTRPRVEADWSNILIWIGITLFMIVGGLYIFIMCVFNIDKVITWWIAIISTVLPYLTILGGFLLVFFGIICAYALYNNRNGPAFQVRYSENEVVK